MVASNFGSPQVLYGLDLFESTNSQISEISNEVIDDRLPPQPDFALIQKCPTTGLGT